MEVLASQLSCGLAGVPCIMHSRLRDTRSGDHNVVELIPTRSQNVLKQKNWDCLYLEAECALLILLKEVQLHHLCLGLLVVKEELTSTSQCTLSLSSTKPLSSSHLLSFLCVV